MRWFAFVLPNYFLSDKKHFLRTFQWEGVKTTDSVYSFVSYFTTRLPAVTDVFESGRNEEPYARDVV